MLGFSKQRLCLGMLGLKLLELLKRLYTATTPHSHSQACAAFDALVLQILELYKQYIDPEFTWKNFSLEEQAKVIVAPRSNNLLDTTRVCRVLCLLLSQSRTCLFDISSLPPCCRQDSW